MRYAFHILPAMLILAACGSKESIQLDLTAGQGNQAFADAQAVDLVIELKSIPGTQGKVVDADGNGVADTYVYPPSCGLAKAAKCGYALADKSNAHLEGLPKGYEYTLKAQFRDSAGVVLYQGTATVNSAQTDQVVTVSIAEL